MFASIRERVRFQGQVQRLPTLYAVSLFLGAVIEFVGIFLVYLIGSMAALATEDQARIEMILGDAGMSLAARFMTKSLLNMVMRPGVLLAIGVVVYLLAVHFGQSSDRKFYERATKQREQDQSSRSKKRIWADSAVFILTLIHLSPVALALGDTAPGIFTAGDPAPDAPWYESSLGYLFATAVFGGYVFFGLVFAVFMLLRKRWATYGLFLFFVFTVCLTLSNRNWEYVSGLTGVVYVMPFVTLWIVIREMKLGVAISKSGRGMTLFLAVACMFVAVQTVNILLDVDPVSQWMVETGFLLMLSLLIFVAYRAINRDIEPGWAEFAAGFMVSYPVLNALISIVSAASSLIFVAA